MRHLLAARRATRPTERAAPSSRRAAREHYQKSRALAGSLPEADAGIAETYSARGEDPAQGVGALRAARAALPGDAGLAQLDARLAIAEGDCRRARTRRDALVDARAQRLRARGGARALLDSIDVRAAIR
jgi:hypothetical protein